ncbi:DeoR/GlpR transcriptional regulator, partial [Anoxybacillus sp. LAT_38]|nr:DeoR/GlpR transcriptional regulator [Anoxybacillus sp. LAT_38]
MKDGDYLLMDASTTVQFAAECMKTTGHVVITNSFETAALLAGRPGIQVKQLGGDVHAEGRYVYGSRAVEMLADYHVDKLLVGACGITASGLVSTSEEHGFLIKEMMKRADQVIVLADH